MLLCPICKENKNTEEFSFRPSGKPASRCKNCQREYSKAHYRRNKKDHNVRRIKRRYGERRRLAGLIASLKDVPCSDCEEKHPSWAMDFDHIREKSFNISQAISLGYSEKRILEEISKCEVVCALCHRYRTWGTQRGVG